MTEINAIAPLLSRLAATPERIALLVEGMSEEELHTRYAQDEWSIAEVFAHIRASDDIITPRIYAILVGDIPPLTSYDERRWSEVARYTEIAFYASLRLFTLRRLEVINMLHHLAPEDWQRIGVHEEKGIQTLLDIVIGQIEHEEEHTTQLLTLSQR